MVSIPSAAEPAARSLARLARNRNSPDAAKDAKTAIKRLRTLYKNNKKWFAVLVLLATGTTAAVVAKKTGVTSLSALSAHIGPVKSAIAGMSSQVATSFRNMKSRASQAARDTHQGVHERLFGAPARPAPSRTWGDFFMRRPLVAAVPARNGYFSGDGGKRRAKKIVAGAMIGRGLAGLYGGLYAHRPVLHKRKKAARRMY